MMWTAGTKTFTVKGWTVESAPGSLLEWVVLPTNYAYVYSGQLIGTIYAADLPWGGVSLPADYPAFPPPNLPGTFYTLQSVSTPTPTGNTFVGSYTWTEYEATVVVDYPPDSMLWLQDAKRTDIYSPRQPGELFNVFLIFSGNLVTAGGVFPEAFRMRPNSTDIYAALDSSASGEAGSPLTGTATLDRLAMLLTGENTTPDNAGPYSSPIVGYAWYVWAGMDRTYHAYHDSPFSSSSDPLGFALPPIEYNSLNAEYLFRLRESEDWIRIMARCWDDRGRYYEVWFPNSWFNNALHVSSTVIRSASDGNGDIYIGVGAIDRSAAYAVQHYEANISAQVEEISDVPRFVENGDGNWLLSISRTFSTPHDYENWSDTFRQPTAGTLPLEAGLIGAAILPDGATLGVTWRYSDDYYGDYPQLFLLSNNSGFPRLYSNYAFNRTKFSFRGLVLVATLDDLASDELRADLPLRGFRLISEWGDNGSRFFLTNGVSHAYLTADFGATWERMTADFEAPFVFTDMLIQLFPMRHGAFGAVAVTEGGEIVFRRAWGGLKNWEPVVVIGDISPNAPYPIYAPLQLQPSSSARLVLSNGDPDTPIVYASDDHGETWNTR